MGGSLPHPPIVGSHTHDHDHFGSHAHDHSSTHHGHRHVHGDNSPIVNDGLAGGQTGGTGSGPAGLSVGLSAGYPGTTGMAGQHYHPGPHEHEHHHGVNGTRDNHHDHHHAEAVLEMPGGDVYRLPSEMGGQEATPAYGQAMAADVAARNPDLGFAGGRVRGQSMVWTDPNQVTDTDSRQPKLGGQIHPGVAEVLARNREIFEPAGPLTELRQQQSRTTHGPLGHEGQAVARMRPASSSAERPRVS
jgi:hypothetical protein